MNPACPACAAEMRPVTLQDVPCFECAHCGGHFMRGEVLDNFLLQREVANGYRGIMEQAQQSPASTRNLACPACRAHSFRVVSSGLIAMDVCELCVGVYLDRGEATAYLLQTRTTTKVWENTTNAASNVVDTADVLETIFNLFN
jgi:Zn-finger nucleic acid-binding protein